MMSLWAPNATFTVGPGQYRDGEGADPEHWLTKSKAFEPTNHWVSDTAAYKIRITVNGDKGTLYFECHLHRPQDAKARVDHGRRSGGCTDRRTSG